MSWMGESVMAKKPLSPAAEAVWEAFNQDEPGVFVDYGDCVAAAFRAAADKIAFKDELGLTAYGGHSRAKQQLLDIADELSQN